MHAYNTTRYGYSLLKLPLPVVKRAHLSGFQPARDTVEVEGMLRKRKMKTRERMQHTPEHKRQPFNVS